MIKNKKELALYLECDRIALNKKKKRPSFLGDDIWKFQRIMRKLDYYSKTRNPKKYWYKLKFHRASLRLGFSIPCNIAGPGLAIVHYGTIVISQATRIGANCRIHAGVNIGANAGEKTAATIGDNVYIGPGAKLIGAITVGDNACIGANAVVTKDVESGVTVDGIPAKVISSNDSSCHLIRATELYNGGNK